MIENLILVYEHISILIYNMPKIESDQKLDFHQVLIRPQRSTINSRSSVSLSRTTTFKYSPKSWTGTPIIAANMGENGLLICYKDCCSRWGKPQVGRR